ncbi:E1-like protein-activating enzyme Gsa7p/Apg7p [Kwoniella dendrophila CBS 6074]|uniref:Ubiquitin-like modifier-activating enzyme ATG7 n=1 Tax=Kwoniella dendrophila CBS 6074 TaxID=1295534 RepID=A0AAX4JR56_9TREE
MPILQFQPLSSQPTPAFWTALTSHKLDKAKLNDEEQWIDGWLEEGRLIQDLHVATDQESAIAHIDGSISIGGNAFGEASESRPVGTIPVIGVLKNYNTIEEFRKTENKKALFDSVVTKIVDSFKSEQPVLNPFLAVTFADLKKYTYHYWFAFPAIVATPAWTIDSDVLIPLDEANVQELRDLEAKLTGKDNNKDGAFLVKGSSGTREVAPLHTYKEFFANIPPDEVTIAFHDSSSTENSVGWSLRNILYYLNSTFAMKEVRVICLRQSNASRSATIRLPANQASPTNTAISAVGWERTKGGKLASRVADLGPMMNPTKLAEQAVDLNLKLMKWRIAPALDLDGIAGTKCLLLGAGTLGCYVARSLMAWGVRQITFVDSGKVSFSNPVRQPLFRFEDCLNGGQPKAACAAERLKEIFPGVNATGHTMNIPMPGHPIPPSLHDSTRQEVEKLEKLIQQHDAVFLLMDSRESRWLPTLLGIDQNKIVINAALGFDTYLVMRHGAVAKTADEKQLGCYYCNDVVAPTDSLTDRSLDQMCTVTRPGVAPLAAASAVELLVSLIQHPLQVHAPAYIPSTTSDTQHAGVLGEVPHQIRGSLNQWRTLTVAGPAYNQCTACSSAVVNMYRQEGIQWLLSIFDRAEILEEVTGLSELHHDTELAMQHVDWAEDSEDDI